MKPPSLGKFGQRFGQEVELENDGTKDKTTNMPVLQGYDLPVGLTVRNLAGCVVSSFEIDCCRVYGVVNGEIHEQKF